VDADLRPGTGVVVRHKTPSYPHGPQLTTSDVPRATYGAEVERGAAGRWTVTWYTPFANSSTGTFMFYVALTRGYCDTEEEAEEWAVELTLERALS